MFPATQKYHISKNKSDQINFILTTTYDSPFFKDGVNQLLAFYIHFLLKASCSIVNVYISEDP